MTGLRDERPASPTSEQMVEAGDEARTSLSGLSSDFSSKDETETTESEGEAFDPESKVKHLLSMAFLARQSLSVSEFGIMIDSEEDGSAVMVINSSYKVASRSVQYNLRVKELLKNLDGTNVM